MADIYTNEDNPELNKEVDSYYDEIIALALLFMAGELTRAQYTAIHIELTEQSIINGVIMAGGVLTSDTVLTMLKEQQAITQESTRKLANDLEAGNYSPNDERTEARAREMLDNRLGLWTFALGSAYVVGQLNKPPQLANIDGEVGYAEPVYQWVLGPTEHCKTCNDAAKEPPQTMSYWSRLAQVGITPQGAGLECGGWNCQCSLVEVAIEDLL